MKKLAVGMLVLALLLAGCSSSDSSGKADTKKDEKDEKVVKKGLLNVEITMPAEFVEGQDVDKMIKEAKDEGVKEVKKNDDGSLTYVMSKADHRKMMKEMKTNLEESIDEAKDGFDSIEDITYNKDFTEFTLLATDKASFNESMDALASFSVGVAGMLYHIFDGEDHDKIQIKVMIKDKSTGEQIDEMIYPDVMDEAKKEAEADIEE
ncbi:hypothetical protein ANABIO32_03410 [Rossellomorea marisflavi]|uniref:hypothetical protein n=1 Tax=Rossellomorea marisflavi TaxID=189381 RepID=UPI0025CAC915|nr:hypothetical protein [Rossellomorea marisflavi]GLI82654.1 hypothetical protein ANABIO32_03410 [Rossellomorea marisflavi]